VGDDVNTVLLDTISQENRGASAYVRPGETIDEKVSGFYQKISTPVLADLALDFGQVRVEDLYPYPLPDLFAGSQMVLVGRYREGGTSSITLEGLVNGQKKSYAFDDLAFRSQGGEPFIARLWATRKIGYLLNEIRLRGANQELVDEVVRLSTTYGIATPYTSFFVPEPQLAAQPGGIGGGGTPMPQATPAPAAVVELSRALRDVVETALQAAPAAAPAGEAAVAESQAREVLRSANTTAGDAESGVRTALDKSFTYQQGLWVDTTYRPDMPKRELAFGDAEYFALLGEHPDWAPYFAVNSNVIVVLGGTALVVTDTGKPLAVDQQAPAVQPVDTSTATAPASPAGTPTAQVAVQPPPAEPSTGRTEQIQVCTVPVFGIGLLLVPGVWAWRRNRRLR
jgi:Ca-activated chloride channel family protein